MAQHPYPMHVVIMRKNMLHTSVEVDIDMCVQVIKFLKVKLVR